MPASAASSKNLCNDDEHPIEEIIRLPTAKCRSCTAATRMNWSTTAPSSGSTSSIALNRRTGPHSKGGIHQRRNHHEKSFTMAGTNTGTSAAHKWLHAVGGNADTVWDSFVQNFHPDATWTLIGETPVSKTHRGLDAIRDNFLTVCWTGDGRGNGSVQGLDQDHGVKITIHEVLEAGPDRVVAICESNGMGNNGVPYTNSYCWVISISDGKISAVHEYCDTALIEKAMFDKRVVPAEEVK